MSDIDRRHLERDAARDHQAAARLLVARVRVGELDEKNLLLAAHLGHEPARLALGLPAAPTAWTSPGTRLESAVGALMPFGRAPLVLAAVTAGKLARAHLDQPSDPRFEELLAVAEAWLARASDQHPRSIVQIVERPEATRLRGPAEVLRLACLATSGDITSAARCASMAVRTALVSVSPATEATVTVFRESIRSTLIGWSLRRREVRSPS